MRIRQKGNKDVTKLTEEILQEQVIKVDYRFFHSKVTLCLAHMQNGFIATGLSGVVDPANYDKIKGKEAALADAMKNIWLVMGYQLQEELWNDGLNATWAAGEAAKTPVK